MKKPLFLVPAITFLVLTITPNANAGSPQSYRWQGVGIGIGAAVLGSMLLTHLHRPYYGAHAPKAWHHSSPRRCAPPRHTVAQGHWEVRKEWVPPVCEKVWNPGHYNRRGCWKAGRWITLQRQRGYWRESRIWVPH
jgi:hypothetical protein